MADPRLAVGWEGINEVNASFIADGSTITFSATAAGGSSQVGSAVTLAADGGSVSLIGDGEFLLGKLISVEDDDVCNVQINGHMTLPAGDGVASLALGKRLVGDLGAAAAEGFIREVATGTAAEMGVARGYTLDDSTLTAVEIML
jgi:hypothetical protein